MSFALGELGLRLDEFYDMPWCEYLIKCFAWERMDREKWRHTRLIAYEARIGSHLNPKSLPANIEAYMPLKSKKRKSKAVIEGLELLKKERDEFYRNNRR